jgi:hypothetical protein
MPGMTTDPGAQDGVTLRMVASDSDGTPTASSSTTYEQMFQEAMAASLLSPRSSSAGRCRTAQPVVST